MHVRPCDADFDMNKKYSFSCDISTVYMMYVVHLVVVQHIHWYQSASYSNLMGSFLPNLKPGWFVLSNVITRFSLRGTNHLKMCRALYTCAKIKQVPVQYIDNIFGCWITQLVLINVLGIAPNTTWLLENDTVMNYPGSLMQWCLPATEAAKHIGIKSNYIKFIAIFYSVFSFYHTPFSVLYTHVYQ